MCDWLKSALTGKVTKVEVSTRLTDSPAALVQGAYGMSPTMQRYMKAQVRRAVRGVSVVSVRARARMCVRARTAREAAKPRSNNSTRQSYWELRIDIRWDTFVGW